MIYNKTNVVGFLICILLSTFSYGMEQYNPMYQEIANLWQAAADQGYTGADLLNDVLINSLTIDPTATKAKAKLKQQQEQENIINTIRDVQMAKTKLSFSPDSDVDASANKIINAKKTISDLMNRHDDQWPNDSVPTSEWNKRIANEAIKLIMGEKIHRDGVLKIINELIDQKARRKGTAYRSFGLIAATNPLKQEKITATKENIKKAIENQIEPSKTEPEEKIVEQKKEQETITKIPETTVVEKEQETELQIKPQEPTKIIVPEKVILEQPIIKPTQKETELKVTEEKPKLIEQTTTATTEKEKAQPEVEKIIETAVKIAEKEAQELEQAKADFAKLQSYFSKLVQEAPLYGYSESELKQFQAIINDFKTKKSFSLEEMNNAKQLFEDLEKEIKAKHEAQREAKKSEKTKLEMESAEAERKKAQNLLKNKVDNFNLLIKQAKEYGIETTDVEVLAKKAAQADPLTQEEINAINKAFASLRGDITKSIRESITTGRTEIQKIAEEKVKAVEDQLKILKPKFDHFKNLIAKAEHSGAYDKKLLRKFKSMIEKGRIYSLEDIKSLEDYFKDLEEKITQEESLAQEKKFIEEYPNRIVAEIEENKKNGIGTVIVHPDAEQLNEYIKNLAKEAKITIEPDTWFDITFGKDIFKFKQLTDGTIEYLKSPNDANRSTIIANPNRSYLLDYTIVPKIENLLTETPTSVYPKEAKEALEERINTAIREQTVQERIEAGRIKKEEQKKQEDIEFAKYQAKKKEEEDKRAAQEKKQIMKNIGATEVQAQEIFNKQKNLESQVDYFTGLVREAKKVGFDNIEQLTQTIEGIKTKNLYFIPVKNIDDEISRVNKAFTELDNALEKQLRGEKEVTYPEFIAKEIKENQYKGIGTVIVHQNSRELTDYIKDLAQQAKVTIVPNTWLDIKIGTDTFKFKQLTDGTLEYLKSPSEPNTATIANRAIIHVLDYTIVPEIKRYLQPYKEVYPEEVLADLQKRINAAKNPTPVVKGEKEQLSESTQAYLKNITQEIESIKRKGFGTVIVHPSATNLIDYIKALAEQNGIKEIKPNTWLNIKFNNDTFIFKQLSDDQKTMLYLKSTSDENKTTTIANPNFFGDWFDNTIVPKIAEIIETQKVDTDIVQQDLQDRINKAKLAKPTEQPKIAAIIPIIQPTTKEPSVLGATETVGLIGTKKAAGPAGAAIVTTTIPVEKQILTPEQQKPIIQPFIPIETEPTIQPTQPTTKSISKQPQKRPVRGRRQTARQQRGRRTPTRRTTTRRSPTRKRTTRSTRTRRTLKRPAKNQAPQQIVTEEQSVV